jgi:hypothetical protein
MFRYQKSFNYIYIKLTLIMFLSLSVLFSCDPVLANERIVLEYKGVVDPHTLNASFKELPYPLNNVKVRLPNLEVPFNQLNSSCSKESKLYDNAVSYLEKVLQDYRMINIVDPKWDTYGTRIIGDIIIIRNGKPISLRDDMIAKGFAFDRANRSKRKIWCN